MKHFLQAVAVILVGFLFIIIMIGLFDFVVKQIFINQRDQVCQRTSTIGTAQREEKITDVRPIYICNY